MIPSSISRRAFIKGSLALGCVTGLGVAAYGREFDPEDLSVERHALSLPRLPKDFDGFTIALLSDFHYGDYVDRLLKSAVEVVNRAQPDVVLLGGDFVTWHHDHVDRLSRDAHACSGILSQLHAPHGVLAVLGNHDYSAHGEIVAEALKYCGIFLLRNNAVALERNKRRLWVGGIDDALEGQPNLSDTWKQVPPDEAKILLAHEPDYADQVGRECAVDLQLSGHSHGGQIRLPFLGAPVLPVLAWKYPMGFYQVGKMQLYTNRGVGMSGPLVRCNCPPEVTLLTLSSEKVPPPPPGSSGDIRLLELE